MFFPNYMNIKSTDEVLEIGPGAYPFWRSDCLADKFDNDSDVDLKQFGGGQLRTKGKPFYKILNNKLPFKNRSFDYIICSHVLEHVPLNDMQALVEEIMRVAPRAYIEFPRPLFDFVYNLDVHKNLMDIVNGEIICIDKANTSINDFNKFQEHLFKLRSREEFTLDRFFIPAIAVGFEFSDGIPLRILTDQNEFFELVGSSDYLCRKPDLFWKLKNKINAARAIRFFAGERGPDFFSNKLLT